MPLEHSIDGDDMVVDGFAAIPAAIIKRVLRQWLINGGVSAAGLSAVHIEAVYALASEAKVHGPVTVVGGVEVHKASGRLRLLN